MRDLRSGLAVLAVTLVLCAPVAVAQVVINEIAWAGTAASANDEWIELYNASEQAVDLSGWTLAIGEAIVHFGEALDATLEVRDVSVDAGGYLLLERTDDTTVSDIDADIVYKGGLSNAGEDVVLTDADGEIVDEVLCGETGWPAGSGNEGDFPYSTMERVHPPVGEIGWASSAPMAAMNGLDADGGPLYGTPGAANGAVLFLASVPFVEHIGPTSDELVGVVAVQWSAEDPDGDDAQLSVQVVLMREDTGAVVIVAENLANSGSLAWDTAEQENGVYRLEVIAEDPDGYLGTASSEPFEILNET